jgi:hypothetical protein
MLVVKSKDVARDLLSGRRIQVHAKSMSMLMSNHAFQRLIKQFLNIEASEICFRQLHRANLSTKGTAERPIAASGATVGWQAMHGLQGESLAARWRFIRIVASDGEG